MKAFLIIGGIAIMIIACAMDGGSAAVTVGMIGFFMFGGGYLWHLQTKSSDNRSGYNMANARITKYKECISKLNRDLLARLWNAYQKMFTGLDSKQINDLQITDFTAACLQVIKARKEGTAKEGNVSRNTMVETAISAFENIAHEGINPLLEAQEHGLDFGIVTNRASNMLGYATADAWERSSNVNKAARSTQARIKAAIDILIDGLTD